MKKTCAIAFISIFLMVAVMWAMPSFAAGAAEKPLIVKGIQIGMDASEAKTAIDKALNNGWTAGAIETREKIFKESNPELGAQEIFENTRDEKPNIDDNGIVIKNKKGYSGGYINIDRDSNKVTQILFCGALTDDLFTATNITADDFLNSLTANFNMPDFFWIPRGWKYDSPLGYTIIFKTDKRLYIKRNSMAPQQTEGKKSLVEFN